MYYNDPEPPPTKWHVRPAKTQISLDIRPVWSESSLSAWRKLGYPLSTQRRLIRLGGCPGWSESSLGAQSFCWFCTRWLILRFWQTGLDKQSGPRWAAARQNQQNHICAQRKLTSSLASAQWSDAQADLNLRWAHMSFCWFCCAAAQMRLFHRSSLVGVGTVCLWMHKSLVKPHFRVITAIFMGARNFSYPYGSS